LSRLSRGRRAAAVVAVLILAVGFYASTFVVSYGDLFRNPDPRHRRRACATVRDHEVHEAGLHRCYQRYGSRS
jgi:hypothetical protein